MSEIPGVNEGTMAQARTRRNEAPPQFYQWPMPLDVKGHRHAGIRVAAGYHFARKAMSVPLRLTQRKCVALKRCRAAVPFGRSPCGPGSDGSPIRTFSDLFAHGEAKTHLRLHVGRSGALTIKVGATLGLTANALVVRKGTEGSSIALSHMLETPAAFSLRRKRRESITLWIVSATRHYCLRSLSLKRASKWLPGHGNSVRRPAGEPPAISVSEFSQIACRTGGVVFLVARKQKLVAQNRQQN